MNKKLCSGLITVGILCSLSSCYAFDYRSEEAGFSVDMPDNNTVIVSKDMFVGGNNKAGMHGINAVSQATIEKYTQATFDTTKFQSDLKAMAAAIKAGKDILELPEYAYLTTPQNELQQYMHNLMHNSETTFPGQKSYKITKINKIPALEIDNEMVVNYKIDLPVAYSKEEQRDVEKYNPYVKFSADGKQMATKYNLISKIYILSQNDQLYNLTSGYIEFPKVEAAEKMNSNDDSDEFIKKLTNTKIDKRAYKKLSKDFTRKLEFFKPQNSNANLVIKDAIFKKDFKVPHDWIYIQSNQKIEATPISFFSALPMSAIEKIGQEYFESKIFDITTTKAGIDVKANTKSADFDLGKLLSAYSEGVIGISAEYKPTRTTDRGPKQFLENSNFTKIIFEEFMSKPIFSPREKARLEKFIKVKRFTHKIDINEKNCLVNFTYDVDLHVPKNFSNFNKPGYNIFTEENLSDLNIYGQKKFYFDADNKINLLCYFTQSRENGSALVQTEYNAYDLFKTAFMKKNKKSSV